MSTIRTTEWADTVALEQIPDERGIAVLLGAWQVAVFRLGALVFAIDHVDPRTGVGVLARGLLGSADGRVFVASPLYKQRFDLRTGECLDAPGTRVATWRSRVRNGRVELLAARGTLER